MSLWIASGGVASADGFLYLKVDDSNTLYRYGTPPTEATIDNSGKTLSITGGTWESWDIKGGASENRPVSGYTLKLSDVSGTFSAEGGNTNTADASGNTVEGINIHTTKVIRGAYSANGGLAYNNTVVLKNSTVSNVHGGYGANAINNSVTLENTTANGIVYGGYTVGDTGNASGNHVTLKNNSHTAAHVIGGYSDSNNGNADGNTVEVIDSEVGGNIIGGYVPSPGVHTAINNTVSLTNSTAVKVYGGSGKGDLVTGNTLNLSGENTAQSIGNFDTVNIVSAVWGTPALTLTDNIGTVNNINTSGIVFSNLDALKEAGENTILIQDGMTNYGGTITGTTYKVGSTLQGKGHAELDGANLKFIADTTAEALTAQEQTHNTVMGAEVGMAALAAGNDFIGAATEGLALASNIGADGVSSFAKMGGGTMRQETGSHINVNTWNAILALGHKNEKEKSTTQYGAFFEYGSGNYTTHNGNERGDGSAHYTGGGLLAKWTARHGLYVEGSLRAGSVHDDARNVLRDANGVPYSYETDAPYLGFHLGVGKEIPLANGDAVDVYGKYFYNRRNGVDFNAGGHYDLDAVTSSVIRLGARYTVNRSKWKFYGGVAYEHELDGKANGTADGVAIRGADTSGGSFRGELGATVTPDKNVPLTLDFNVTGFAGTKQGLSGGVSVALMF